MGAANKWEMVEGLPLTLQERDFVIYYLNDGHVDDRGQETRNNATASYRLAYAPKGKARKLTDSSYYTLACRLLARSQVKESVKALLAQSVTPEWIVDKLRKEATLSTNKGADRIRATELLGKTMAMFADKTETVVKMEGILMTETETFDD